MYICESMNACVYVYICLCVSICVYMSTNVYECVYIKYNIIGDNVYMNTHIWGVIKMYQDWSFRFFKF